MFGKLSGGLFAPIRMYSYLNRIFIRIYAARKPHQIAMQPVQEK
jgi:hypothetical protein